MAAYHGEQASRPSLAFFFPLGLLVAYFAMYIIGAIATIGDGIDQWLLSKIVSKPDPRNVVHQLLYLLLSSIGSVLSALFMSLVTLTYTGTVGTGGTEVRTDVTRMSRAWATSQN